MGHSVRRLIPLALAAFAAVGGGLPAQDLERDLPWRRPDVGLVDQELIELACERLVCGWDWEAARLFRELTVRQPDRPLGPLGLALALRRQPNRAARLCWDAVELAEELADEAAGSERVIVAAYRRYFGVDRQPELVDAAFRAAPPEERLGPLIRELENVPGAVAGRLVALERLRQHEIGYRQRRRDPEFQRKLLRAERKAIFDDDDADLRALLGEAGERPRGAPGFSSPREFLGVASPYLQRTGTMPLLVPGYDDAVRAALASRVGELQEREADRIAARLPRHPQLPMQRQLPRGPLPGFDLDRGADIVSWRPRQAPAFDLPRGLGGRGTLSDYAGKPVLVVFFLGFG